MGAYKVQTRFEWNEETISALREECGDYTLSTKYAVIKHWVRHNTDWMDLEDMCAITRDLFKAVTGTGIKHGDIENL